MCKFCESLDFKKTVDAFYSEENGLRREYTVAIVTKSWLPKNGKKSAGVYTDYRHRGLGYKLNYCPECGRRL